MFGIIRYFCNMKKVIGFLIVCILKLSVGGEVRGQGVQAVLNHGLFMLSGKSPYLETWLMVRGSSVVFKSVENSQFKASIEIILTLTEGETIRFADKYVLNSPLTNDTSHIGFNFIDQQRVPLTNGTFELELLIRDLNSDAEAISAKDLIEVNFPKEEILISSIQLVETYTKAEKVGPLTKAGYDLVPHVSDYFPYEESELSFFVEFYNSLPVLGEGEKFVVNYGIRNKDRNELIQRFSGFKRFSAGFVSPLLNSFDIKSLSTGNYEIFTEVKDKDNKLIAERKQAFYRLNDAAAIEVDQIESVNINGTFAERYTSFDTLREYIRCLYPLSTALEQQFAVNAEKSKDIQRMQQFFYSFWLNRDNANPEAAWLIYLEEVRIAQKEFSTSIRRGYNTDRGRVFLQYGKPDNRTVSTREPSAYPYEIWHYYKVKDQTNRRFVFYNPDLVTNDYSLIHSDARGEIMNDQWQFLIFKRDTQVNDIDATTPDQSWGSQLQQNFQTPR